MAPDFGHLTKSWNKIKISDIESLILLDSFSSLSIKEYKSSNLFENSSLPEISPSFSNKLSIIEIEFSKSLLSIVFFKTYL